MPGRIVGINRSSLWRAWKEIRIELRRASVRDVVDFLDYDIEPEVWITRLLRQIATGTYEPHFPTRFPVAKSSGFKRNLTFPAIPDLVLYRAIADHIHQRARKQQQPHVYYRRTEFEKAAEAAGRAAGQKMQRLAADYRFTSVHSFLNWLNYAQYRRHLIMQRVYPYLVTSDITNFFDSVLHSEVANAFRDFPIPSRMIGLLFFLLERLAIRADYSDSPRIGLPVDEFECSRSIANLVLFSHDRRIVKIVGRDAYVRWMDDQVIGVKSQADGLRVLAALGSSLANLYLTPNAEKSKVLSLSEAKLHFHLDTNGALDAVEGRITTHAVRRRTLVRELSRVWRMALQNEGEGQWSQIQKRFYRLGGITKARFLRRRAMRDLLQNPTLAERVSDYMRCSGSVAEYMKFVRSVLKHKEQIHDDVVLIMVESLLRLETSGPRARAILRWASELLREISGQKRSADFAAPACLLILRFSDPRNISSLRRCFQESKAGAPRQAVRAAAIVYASYGRKEFNVVRRAAAMLLINPLASMVKLVQRVMKFEQVPERYKARLMLRRDSVSGRQYIDMRTFLAARLLALNRGKAIRSWLKTWVTNTMRQKISAFDKRLVRSLIVV